MHPRAYAHVVRCCLTGDTWPPSVHVITAHVYSCLSRAYLRSATQCREVLLPARRLAACDSRVVLCCAKPLLRLPRQALLLLTRSTRFMQLRRCIDSSASFPMRCLCSFYVAPMSYLYRCYAVAAVLSYTMPCCVAVHQCLVACPSGVVTAMCVSVVVVLLMVPGTGELRQACPRLAGCIDHRMCVFAW